MAVETGPDAATMAERPPTGRFLRAWLPMAGLAILCGLAILFVATQADDYGRTWDEGLQNYYGQSILKWYLTGGKDLEFTLYWSGLHMPEHGPVIETVIAFIQSITNEEWLTRSVVGGVIGILGLVGIALCGYELAAWWGALLAATGLALYPRFTGAMFNNTKDVPLAVGVVFVLWAALRLVRRWDGRRYPIADSALLGLFIGLAAAIRINALFWYGLLALAAGVWWLRHGRAARADGRWRAELGRQALAAGIIVVGSYLTMLATWPFLYLHPIGGLIDSFRVMSAYDWDGTVLFDGTMVRAQDLPWQYLPGWLVVGSPPAVIALALLGAGYVGVDLVRRRAEAPVLLVAGSFLLPVAVILGLHSTLYNGLRHVLFVVPSLILLGVYGLLRAWQGLIAGRRYAVAAAVAGLVLIAQVEVVVSCADLHPYEYTYFSPVAGGLAGAGPRYETDYWRSCETEAIHWILANSGPEPVTIGGLFDPITELRGTAAYQEQDPDYAVASPYAAAPAGYQPLYDVTRDGIVFCTVTKRP